MSAHRLSLRARVFAGFAVVTAVLGVQLWISLARLGRIHEIRATLTAVVDPRVVAAEEVERAILYRAITLRNLVTTDTERHREAYARATAASEAARARLRAASDDEETRARVERMDERFRVFERVRDGFLDEWRAGADRDTMLEAEARLAGARERVLDEVRGYAELARRQRAELRAAADDAQAQVRAALLASGVLLVLVLVGTAVITHAAVRRPAARLVRAARALEAGDFGPALAARTAGTAKDELDALGDAFATMAATLQRREARLAAEGRIAAALARHDGLEGVADETIEEVARFTGAELAAVYVGDAREGTLQRVAGRLDGGGAGRIAVEGLVAHALASGAPETVRDLPADAAFTIRLGIDALPPRAVVAAPMRIDAEHRGVLVLASARDLSGDALAFAGQAAAQLGVAVQKALAHRRVSDLAEELQHANDALHGHVEELQAQREQLQAQTEELQAQAEELQAQTEELHAQADEIHRQNDALRAGEETLRARTRALEDVDRRKAEFLATLGHELRNPLAAVLNAAHLIEAAGCEPDVARHAAVVGRQAAQLRRLVDDLLDVSRINHGKVELRLEPLDLRHAIEQAVDATRPALESRAHRLTVSAPPAGLRVLGDAARVQQIVSNVLHNAAKYTPHGGLIDLRVEAADGVAALTVRDNGIGIEADLLPHVFDAFTQGDTAHKQGLGLGLALVRQLVRMHGGDVVARSEGPGRGSTFRITLPLHAAGEAEAAPAAPRRRARAERRPLEILLVEDNRDLADTMTDMLGTFGHHCDAAHDAESALARLQGRAYDVALLDIGLPGMDGYALAGELRARFPGSRMRLVALTGYAQPEDRGRAHEAGFELHLAKPVDPEELRRVLARMAEQDAPARPRGREPELRVS